MAKKLTAANLLSDAGDVLMEFGRPGHIQRQQQMDMSNDLSVVAAIRDPEQQAAAFNRLMQKYPKLVQLGELTGRAFMSAEERRRQTSFEAMTSEQKREYGMPASYFYAQGRHRPKAVSPIDTAYKLMQMGDMAADDETAQAFQGMARDLLVPSAPGLEPNEQPEPEPQGQSGYQKIKEGVRGLFQSGNADDQTVDAVTGAFAPTPTVTEGLGQMPSPKDEAEYKQLPSGVLYRHPDGTVRKKH